MSQLERLASMYALFFENRSAVVPGEEDPVTVVKALAEDVTDALKQLVEARDLMEKHYARLTDMLEKRPLTSRTTNKLEACRETLRAIETTLDRLGAEALREAAHIATCSTDTLQGQIDDAFAAVA